MSIDNATVGSYIDLFLDAFMLYKAERYDVIGRKYIGIEKFLLDEDAMNR